ncbi:squalene synthetase [Histoplasma capsulatum H143]|uniref:Squalene synthase n=1 Tax=Ajellomyces capsulatus (strain H143) TaxID=544712 RepID=C6HH40_AJECH|nr:squalene synthetase [Histoplasma capsulatum H143]
MVGFTDAIYYLVHPQELRSIIQWKMWHNPVHERDEKNVSETQKKCFEFLELTSRSFSAVIMELHPELLLPVCLFYLALRGLDTIEDDTSIPLQTKEPLLRDFHNILEKDGWSFNGNRPEEKDRELLVQFHNVVTEFKLIKPAYRTIIKDTTKKMGSGMADYCRKAELDTAKVKTVKEYDLYCYYVAGIVGEGLTRLFLFISMGLFLQKTNIIRDVKEDYVDNRCFWPQEIWSKHVDDFEDLFKRENREAALNCNSEMILNALGHADECLFYLAGLREQSVFNFCAIPQSMAIATLELCFRNEAIFERNIKITKGSACQLMFQSTQNVRAICDVFRQYGRKIHKKNTPKDPNFLKISVACGKVETFIESIFPSQTVEGAQRKAKQEPSAQEAEQARLDAEARQDIMYIMLALFGILAILTAIMIFAAWLMGARFDLAFQQIKQGNLRPPPRISNHQEL